MRVGFGALVAAATLVVLTTRCGVSQVESDPTIGPQLCEALEGYLARCPGATSCERALIGECSTFTNVLGFTFMTAVLDCVNGGGAPTACFGSAAAGLTPGEVHASFALAYCGECAMSSIPSCDAQLFGDSSSLPEDARLAADLVLPLSDGFIEELAARCATQNPLTCTATFPDCLETMLTERGFSPVGADCFMATALGLAEVGTCVGGDGDSDADVDADSDSDSDSDGDVCAPETCTNEGLECGRSSCGADCGGCDGSEVCEAGHCICTSASCSGEALECGTSSCGYDCGGCEGAAVCEGGACACPAASCTDEGLECGDSSCGHDCGGCRGDASCDGTGHCTCSPDGHEPNDTQASAISLAASPISDEEGGFFSHGTSSIHSDSDIDWYTLQIEDVCCFTYNFDAIAILSRIGSDRPYRVWLEFDCHDGYDEEIDLCEASSGERQLSRGGVVYGCEVSGSGPSLTVSMEVNCLGTASETGTLYIGVEPTNDELRCEPYMLDVEIR